MVLFFRENQRADEIEENAGSPAEGQYGPGDPDQRGIAAQKFRETSANAGNFLIAGAFVQPPVHRFIRGAGEILINKVTNGQTGRNRHDEYVHAPWTGGCGGRDEPDAGRGERPERAGEAER